MAPWQILVRRPLVKDETVKPAPTEYPPLLPTLQTRVGMVLNNGEPAARNASLQPLDQTTLSETVDRATTLRAICTNDDTLKDAIDLAKVESNLQACSLLVTKSELLDYIRHRKRIDTEQAVAMVIAYLYEAQTCSDDRTSEALDEFEGDSSAIQELMTDRGVVSMIKEACMWREEDDNKLARDAREVAAGNKKTKILRLLDHDAELGQASSVVSDKTKNTVQRLLNQATKPSNLSDLEFATMLQKLRRRRRKYDNSQHLTMPASLIPGDDEQKQRWLPERSYMLGYQEPIPDENAQIISKRKFRRIHRLLHSLLPPVQPGSLFALDVGTLIKKSGATSARRMAALEASEDPFAVAYGFIAAQRQFQLKVVSDHGWSRFLVKGEGAMLLQNRPEVLTSFEDVLIRHANDLVALTAIKCPTGLRDHFSTHQDIKDRAREICELMERYVEDFGDGKMQNLVPSRMDKERGPVDFYNALCDELRDCSRRAKATGIDLDIGPVYKFLALDIMAWNQAWNDDAFAGGKIPGWVEYLARVRAEEISLS